MYIKKVSLSDDLDLSGITQKVRKPTFVICHTRHVTHVTLCDVCDQF